MLALPLITFHAMAAPPGTAYTAIVAELDEPIRRTGHRRRRLRNESTTASAPVRVCEYWRVARSGSGRAAFPACQNACMSVRALSFGAIAEAYERFRPGYPEALFEVVAAYAGEPIRTALEIGAGTGKATRLFTGHGVEVTATEPDAAMLAELRKAVPTGVKSVQAAFEDLRPAPGEAFGLVYAAAALHWTNPEGRWPRVAALLRPHGVFASFGGPLQPADPALEEAVRAARAPFLERDDIPSPDGTAPEREMQWPGTELLRSDLFTDVRQSVVERRFSVSDQDYIGHLSTISAYLQLPAATREQVFEAIARVLPETVEIAADITVHLARRRPE